MGRTFGLWEARLNALNGTKKGLGIQSVSVFFEIGRTLMGGYLDKYLGRSSCIYAPLDSQDVTKSINIYCSEINNNLHAVPSSQKIMASELLSKSSGDVNVGIELARCLRQSGFLVGEP